MSRITNRSGRSNRHQGFTLLEVLVTLAIVGLIFISFLNIFDTTAEISKAQGSIADITEHLRYGMTELVRVTRMIGTGGLPLATTDASGSLGALAVVVTDNVPQGTMNVPTTPQMSPLPGTDVYLVRGVLTGTLYDAGSGSISSSGPPWTITMAPTSPWGGQAQPGIPLSEGDPILLSAIGEFIVASSSGARRFYSDYDVGVVHADVSMPGPTENFVVPFRAPGSDTSEDYIRTMNRLETFALEDPDLVVTIGFPSEIWYFIALNEAGEPSLFRWLRGRSTADELVPNVSDLQIALGCDLNNDGQVNSSLEWFHDNDAEVPTGQQLLTLRQVRISLIGRGNSPEITWEQNSVGRQIQLPENADALDANALKYRHSVLTVRVAPRSHPPLE